MGITAASPRCVNPDAVSDWIALRLYGRPTRSRTLPIPSPDHARDSDESGSQCGGEDLIVRVAAPFPLLLSRVQGIPAIEPDVVLFNEHEVESLAGGGSVHGIDWSVCRRICYKPGREVVRRARLRGSRRLCRRSLCDSRADRGLRRRLGPFATRRSIGTTERAEGRRSLGCRACGDDRRHHHYGQNPRRHPATERGRATVLDGGGANTCRLSLA